MLIISVLINIQRNRQTDAIDDYSYYMFPYDQYVYDQIC